MGKLAGEELLFYHLASPFSPVITRDFIIFKEAKLVHEFIMCFSHFQLSCIFYLQKEYYSFLERDNQERQHTTKHSVINSLSLLISSESDEAVRVVTLRGGWLEDGWLLVFL